MTDRIMCYGCDDDESFAMYRAYRAYGKTREISYSESLEEFVQKKLDSLRDLAIRQMKEKYYLYYDLAKIFAYQYGLPNYIINKLIETDDPKLYESCLRVPFKKYDCSDENIEFVSVQIFIDIHKNKGFPFTIMPKQFEKYFQYKANDPSNVNRYSALQLYQIWVNPTYKPKCDQHSEIIDPTQIPEEHLVLVKSKKELVKSKKKRRYHIIL